MKKEFVEVMNQLGSKGEELGFYHLMTEDERFDGKHITIRGKKYLFFSNCSYLGLEINPEMKAAAIDATERYGIQLCSSRATVSLGLFKEAESLLAEMFNKPCYLTASTSLGHIAIIPTMFDENDAIIMDQQVHNSVKNAVQMVKPEGVHTEIIKHNRLDVLETRLQILQQNYKRVWYMIDSVYSQYGDVAPFDELYKMLNKYEQFYLYVDDAHGMSWAGKNGRGYVLSKIPHHDKMILTTSLGKGFGCCGGVIVCNDEPMKSLIKNCSSTSIFSGPIPPGPLGGIIASAKIHLTDQIDTLQDELFEKMFYFTQTASRMQIPIVNNLLTPVFFIAIGKREVGYKLSSILHQAGYYCMTTVFPAVPMKNSGLRITVTNHHSFSDIDGLLGTIAEALPGIMKEENYSMEEIYNDFGMTVPGKGVIEMPIERRKIA